MKEKIDKWLKEFLEIPNPNLGGWAPCPYARAARINNKIEIIEGDATGKDIEELIETTDWSKDAYIFWYPVDLLDLKTFRKMNNNLNKEYMPKDVVILGDHPDSGEEINGVRMNFDHASLQIVQKLSKLNETSEKIEKQGYYDTWPKESYDEVVTRRRDGI